MSNTATLEKRIYGNYRTALKSFRKNAALEGDGTAASDTVAVRKRKARAVTAERFHLTEKEIRDIVREMDAQNGIIHEYPQAELIAAQKELDKNPQVCKHCGSGELAFAVWDDWDFSIYGEHNVSLRCENCL